MRVLILGGTAEARELAARLAGRADVLTSLAGAVSDPVLPRGEVRIGAIGAVDGLASLLTSWSADVLVDATHPFAAGITGNAVAAAAATPVPLIVLRRPPWQGVGWQHAADVQAAAAAVRALPPGLVFLTTGRRDLAAFAGDDHEFLIRSIEPPTGPLPARATLLQDRGPYTVEAEMAVMARASVLVTKNSGGVMTAAKLVAAERLGMPVLMVDRPPLPPGVQAVADVAAVLRRLRL